MTSAQAQISAGSRTACTARQAARRGWENTGLESEWEDLGLNPSSAPCSRITLGSTFALSVEGDHTSSSPAGLL